MIKAVVNLSIIFLGIYASRYASEKLSGKWDTDKTDIGYSCGILATLLVWAIS